ncbi:MAG TPA: Npt1/Npt2 family nucleotide transporter [Gemmatimonadota bacterium]|nr:Npt1/Npt2 family nucleotide transporter [Gemmatimonadota bacterium]
MNPATRVLRLFVDVKKREVEPAFLFFFFWFLVIVTFQVLKPLKKGYFVEALGADVELYAKLANIGVAILAVILFTALYNRLGSRKLIAALVGIFVLALLGFAAVLGDTAPDATVNWVFYLFGDAWSTIWVTTFWAYLNEMTQSEQSKRLYGLIGGGGVVGGLVGGLVVWQLVEPVGASTLLTACAIVTLIIGVLVWRAEMLARSPGSPIGRRDTNRLQVEPQDKKMNAAVEGARLAMASRYLLSIVMIVFLYELVSQILDYQYATEAETLVGAGATQAFFGQVTTIIGVVSVITQFFLVSFIIRKFGMTSALMVLPVAMAVASGVYFVLPVLWAGALLTISDNSFSYSINQTARETLYVPTSSDVKYKARAFANMFVQRVGKGAAILMALALTAVPIRFLSILAVVVVVVWAGFAIYAGRRFDELTGDEPERRLEEALEG